MNPKVPELFKEFNSLPSPHNSSYLQALKGIGMATKGLMEYDDWVILNKNDFNIVIKYCDDIIKFYEHIIRIAKIIKKLEIEND